MFVMQGAIFIPRKDVAATVGVVVENVTTRPE
jgi:hypothetical protein